MSEEERMSETSTVSLRAVSAVTTDKLPFVPWDNPENIISAETKGTVQKVIVCGASEVVMILGISGNVVNMVVFTRQGLKDRVTLMLFCLALFDLLTLLSYFSMSVHCFIEPVDPVLAWNVENVQLSNAVYINLMAALLSMSMVTVLSVDRCLAITLPLKAASILTYKRTVVTVVVVSVMTMGLYIPNLWVDAVIWVNDPVSNRSVAQVVPAEFAYQHPLYIDIFRTYRIASKMVCLVVVVICCSITVKTLKAARKIRSEMAETKFRRSEVQITVMLLFVCTVMVLCLLPEQIYTVMMLMVTDFYVFKKYHNIFLTSYYFISLAQCVNSASNFFLYVLLSSKFRGTLMELRPCRQK